MINPKIMNTTHYYLEKGHCNVMKSKLHEAISKYFSSLSGMLIKVDELETVKDIFTVKVKLLNMEFKRCKPVELRFHSYGLNKDQEKTISVHGIDGMSFSMKACSLSNTVLIQTNF